MSSNRQIFSLKQVVSSIRRTLEDRYQQTYWVKAEMHKINLYPSGHAFPELVQKENDKIVAQITGSIWAHNFLRINKQFMTVVKEPLKEGSTLLLQVKIAFSETYGLSLQILDIDPNYALGELQRERDETLRKLQAERLINRNQQLDFPLLPKRIAIISADTSKGLSDFKKILTDNPWNYQFFTLLFPAYLQGDVAAASIVEQLRRIDRVKHHFDVVVIVRGGGGEVGLSCYNNYTLCKEIAMFSIPVLTGIGHSTNMTVAELVAFRNAITPTELADFLLQAFHDFAVPVKDAKKALKVYGQRLLEKQFHLFEAETKHFKNSATLFLNAAQGNLLQTSQRFKNDAKSLLLKEKEFIRFTQLTTLSFAKRFFKEQKVRIFTAQTELPQRYFAQISAQKRNIDHLENAVRLMDPKNVLRRGYSITTRNGKTIHAGMTLNPGDTIQTITYDLQLDSKLLTRKEQDD
jgi:exodeoxyribonuclease VII large subunit